MRKSIYKITNLKNKKAYIGQSKDPQKRFLDHCYNKSYISLIHLAIQKEGKENFSLEILEEDIENYNERERFWIKQYNSLTPNGYNIAEGGEDPPILKGQENFYTTHTDEEVALVKKLLKETSLSTLEIAKQTGYKDASAVNRINVGKIWNDPDETYPIRKDFLGKAAIEERWTKIVDYLKNSELTHKEIGDLCGVKRSTVTMINNGSNGKRFGKKYNIDYPIRKPVETIPGETGSTLTIDT